MADGEGWKQHLSTVKIIGLILAIIVIMAFAWLATVGNASNADPRSPEELLIQKYTAPANSDPIAGTWWGTKTTSLVILTWQVEGNVICYPNNTGVFSGLIRGPFVENGEFSQEFIWESIGNGEYRAVTENGIFEMKIIEDQYAGRLLQLTMNPKELGISDILSMDIVIDMMPLA